MRSRAGDESEAFIKEIDVLVRIGGGQQSFADTEIFTENGGRTYEFDLAAFG